MRDAYEDKIGILFTNYIGACLRMKIVLKLNIIKSRNGVTVSDTKHLKLGEKLILDEGESIISVEFDDVKMIYTAKDCDSKGV